MRADTAVFWTIWVVAIAGGVLIVIAAMYRRLKIIEMDHRERMALIERGLTPPPNLSDPLAMIAHKKASMGGPHQTFGPQLVLHDYPGVRRSRLLSGGIVTVGFGLALMTLLAVAAESFEIAVGVGGAVAILGLSFVVIALVQGGPAQSPANLPSPSAAGPPPMAPDNKEN